VINKKQQQAEDDEATRLEDSEAPSADKEPSAGKEPLSEKEPSAGEKPPAGEKPSADKEPTAAEEAAEAAESAEEAVADIAGAEITLEHLQEELAAAKDAALRAQAEAQNARRRAEQEVEKARKYALERFAGALLPVVDNMERSIEAVAEVTVDEVKPIAEGVELTLKSLMEVLGKFNIEQINPVGEPFDPQLHQAMTMVPNPDLEPNTVMDVMQKGYTLSGRLIRPAMVVVSKGPEQ
jgi:molecular chaperone GrpE